MTRYAITFGSQYGIREVHPVAPMLDHSSFVQLEAPSYESAHAVAMRLFEGRFAFLYLFEGPTEDFSRQIREYGLTDKTVEFLSYIAITS